MQSTLVDFYLCKNQSLSSQLKEFDKIWT